MRPERSEAVLNKARHKKSIARDFTVRHRISHEGRGTRDKGTQSPFALSPEPGEGSKGSTGKSVKGAIINKRQVTWDRRAFLVTRPSSLAPLRKQKGFAIAAAIFLIVVLALLAVGMVQIASTSHSSLSQEYTSARAYMAARSGLQWGMYQAIYAGNGNSTITFSGGALAGTQATVTSNSTSVDDNSFYTIDSNGVYGSSSDAEYSLRQLHLRFSP